MKKVGKPKSNISISTSGRPRKASFVVKGDRENEYAVALSHPQMLDGDIIEYLVRTAPYCGHPHPASTTCWSRTFLILTRQTPETIIHISVELGHAIGNQHWPAVVKGTKVYIPLTVDKK